MQLEVRRERGRQSKREREREREREGVPSIFFRSSLLLSALAAASARVPNKRLSRSPLALTQIA